MMLKVSLAQRKIFLGPGFGIRVAYHIYYQDSKNSNVLSLPRKRESIIG